jgi:hypothetical protein
MPRRFLALCFFAVLARLAAQPHCTDQSVRVTAERHGDKVHFFAEPGHCTEATLTLSADLTNMRCSVPLPLTREVRGHERVELGVLHPAGEGRWSYRYRYNWMVGSRGGRPDGTVYRLPFAEGSGYRLGQGYRGAFSHQAGTINEYALDFTMPEGTPVLAARDGVIIAVRQDSDHGGADERFKQCGNYVAIRHADGTCAEYFHLKQGGARVQLGDTVRAGQVIALSGNTGFSTTPHLHFVVFRTIDGLKRESLKVPIANSAGTPLALVPGRTY